MSLPVGEQMLSGLTSGFVLTRAKDNVTAERVSTSAKIGGRSSGGRSGVNANSAQIVTEPRFEAVSSLVTEWVKGKTVDQAGTITNKEIAKELSLPPVKIHCSVLAEDAIKAAINDYKKKQSATSGASVGQHEQPIA